MSLFLISPGNDYCLFSYSLFHVLLVREDPIHGMITFCDTELQRWATYHLSYVGIIEILYYAASMRAYECSRQAVQKIMLYLLAYWLRIGVVNADTCGFDFTSTSSTAPQSATTSAIRLCHNISTRLLVPTLYIGGKVYMMKLAGVHTTALDNNIPPNLLRTFDDTLLMLAPFNSVATGIP